MTLRRIAIALSAAALLLGSGAAFAADDWSIPVKGRTPPFDANGTWSEVQYTPLEKDKVTKKWHVCVLYPHTKDPYYIAMTYGAVSEAEAKGLQMTINAAGGYTELPTQISQMEDCAAQGADAIFLVAISATGLNRTIDNVTSKGIPIAIAGGDVDSDKISAKALGQYTDAGKLVGDYLTKLHPPGSEKVKVLWMAGPEGPRWSRDAADGFLKSIEGNDAIEVVKVIWGDSGKDVQIPLIEDGLQAYPDINYIGGIAPAIEGAVQILREKNREDIKLLSFYITPPVEQAVRDGKVMGVVSDYTALQARVAVDQLVRILEKQPVMTDLEPGFFMIDASNVNSYDRSSSLAPEGWEPYFKVD
ncbi:MAG: TMAO reductase system periplasmic protein TorT [Gammaproteobacteria bacterium]